MSYLQIAPGLINNGYIPIPIVPRDKAPAVKGWRDPAYTPPTGYGGYGVGIKCGVGDYPVAGLDLDITDCEISNQMKDYVEMVPGGVAYRIGNAPKLLFPFRHEKAGVRKIVSKKYECGRVEVLGEGQQFVACGTHPDTKRPYDWWNGDPEEIKASELPILTAADIKDLICYYESLCEERGLVPISKDKSDAPAIEYDPNDPLDRVEPLGIPIDEARAMLDALDPDCGRDDWRNVGMALHHEYDGSDEALALWDEWSAQGSKYREGEPEKQWDSFGRSGKRPLTMATVKAMVAEVEEEKGVIVDTAVEAIIEPTAVPEPVAEVKAEPTKPEEQKTDKRKFFQGLNWSPSRFVDDPPEIPMIIDDFLPKGIVTLFYSAGGVGKSTIILNMAAKIALAHKYDVDFLGHALKGGRAVIVTAEDPELILNRRYVAALRDLANELDVDYAEMRAIVDSRLSIVSTFAHSVQLFGISKDGTKLLPTEYYASLIECLQEIPELQLVVIDTKTRYSPGEGNGNVVTTQEVTYYEKIARITGASVMLLHHTNKTSRDGSQTGMQAYRDATALYDSVRAAWFLRSLKKDEAEAAGIDVKDLRRHLYLENAKNNYIEMHEPIILRREGYCYAMVGPAVAVSKEEQKDREAKEQVDMLLTTMQSADKNAWTHKELADACGESMGWRRLRNALKLACSLGLIEEYRGARGQKYTYHLTQRESDTTSTTSTTGVVVSL